MCRVWYFDNMSVIILHYSYVLGYNSFNTVTFVLPFELQGSIVKPHLAVMVALQFRWFRINQHLIYLWERASNAFISLVFLLKEIVMCLEERGEDLFPLLRFACNLKPLLVCCHIIFYSSVLQTLYSYFPDCLLAQRRSLNYDLRISMLIRSLYYGFIGVYSLYIERSVC